MAGTRGALSSVPAACLPAGRRAGLVGDGGVLSLPASVSTSTASSLLSARREVVLVSGGICPTHGTCSRETKDEQLGDKGRRESRKERNTYPTHTVPARCEASYAILVCVIGGRFGLAVTTTAWPLPWQTVVRGGSLYVLDLQLANDVISDKGR